MSLSKDDILNAVADMSVMDIVELIEAMEEKFGVTAAAAVAAAPAAAGGDAGGAAEDGDATFAVGTALDRAHGEVRSPVVVVVTATGAGPAEFLAGLVAVHGVKNGEVRAGEHPGGADHGRESHRG